MTEFFHQFHAPIAPCAHSTIAYIPVEALCPVVGHCWYGAFALFIFFQSPFHRLLFVRPSRSIAHSLTATQSMGPNVCVCVNSAPVNMALWYTHGELFNKSD